MRVNFNLMQANKSTGLEVDDVMLIHYCTLSLYIITASPRSEVLRHLSFRKANTLVKTLQTLDLALNQRNLHNLHQVGDMSSSDNNANLKPGDKVAWNFAGSHAEGVHTHKHKPWLTACLRGHSIGCLEWSLQSNHQKRTHPNSTDTNVVATTAAQIESATCQQRRLIKADKSYTMVGNIFFFGGNSAPKLTWLPQVSKLNATVTNIRVTRSTETVEMPFDHL